MEFKNILVIQTAFLGDVILSTPTIRAIKQIFPYSKIDVLTIPATSIIFDNNPHTNETILFNKKPALKKLSSLPALISKLRKNDYDLGISLHRSLTSSLLMLLGNIPERIGYHSQKFLTMPISHEKGLHLRYRYLCLVRPFTDYKFDDQTEIFWSDDEEEKVLKIVDSFNNKFPIIGIAPGSVWPTKRWPKEYFVELLQKIAQENVNIIFIGGKEEKELCNQIISQSNTRALNMAGNLTVLESTALIEKIDLLVTNDSAPLHMANAVKTDVIAMFGPTVKRFGCYPYRENDKIMEVELYCRPCSKHGGKACPENHFRCMKEILPENVYKEIQTRLHRSKHEKK